MISDFRPQFSLSAASAGDLKRSIGSFGVGGKVGERLCALATNNGVEFPQFERKTNMRKSYQFALSLALGAAMVSPASAGVRADRGMKGGIVIQPAYYEAGEGLSEATLADGSTVFVSRDALRGTDLAAVNVVRLGDGQGIEVTLSDAALDRAARADALVVTKNNRVLGIAPIDDGTLESGTAIISEVDASMIGRITGQLRADAAAKVGPVIQLVPANSTVAAGGEVAVDVYVGGIDDLRTFQITLDTSDGVSGELRRVRMLVDSARDDFVFGSGQMIKAEDLLGGRMGAVHFHGGVDAVDLAYAGTFTFKATRDAAGTFDITVRAGAETFLMDGTNTNIDFSAVNTAVSVGEPSTAVE